MMSPVDGTEGSSAAAAAIARSRKVTFLVPASATPGFLSQIAALQLALRRLPWTRWQADIVACFGDRPGLESTFQLSRWLPYLADVTMVFPRERATEGDYDGQIDELYRAAPIDADVLVRADADTLPVANLEPLLDFVFERSAVAGVTAHYRFPSPPRVGNREAWDAVAQGFLDEPLRFDHSYSLVTPDVSRGGAGMPLLPERGFVVFAREYFDRSRPSTSTRVRTSPSASSTHITPGRSRWLSRPRESRSRQSLSRCASTSLTILWPRSTTRRSWKTPSSSTTSARTSSTDTRSSAGVRRIRSFSPGSSTPRTCASANQCARSSGRSTRSTRPTRAHPRRTARVGETNRGRPEREPRY